MLVRRIKEFTTALQSLANLTHCDSAILESLLRYFFSKDDAQPLDDAAIEFIKNHFNQRCMLIARVSDLDYTAHPTPVNILYVALAKELADEQNTSYLQILYPTVVNTNDPNDFSTLADMPIDYLFWFADDPNDPGVPKLLYSITGVAHQVKHSHTLSTRRALLGPLCALTMSELSQLRGFSDRNQAFRFESKVYRNFWVFLQEELFATLNFPLSHMIAHLPDRSNVLASRASDAPLFLAIERIQVRYSARKQLPAHLLSTIIPPLLLLVEQYSIFGFHDHNFQYFKSISKYIFRTISALNLSDINRIYLAKIFRNGQEMYLLDLLISIYDAKAADINDSVLILSEWLAPFKLPLSGSTSHLPHFKNLILSLFLIEFHTLRPTLDTIGLYDQQASVFRGAKALYSEVEGLIESNNLSEINALFPELKTKYIEPFLDGTSASRGRWYRHALNNTLSELGVHWEEPELLAHVMVHPMLQLVSIATETHLKIKIFLDELIRTYIQPNELINDLQRGFRVNILFNRLLKDISEQDKNNLYLLLDIFRGVHVNDLFISNCVRHMHQTIVSISGPVFFRRGSHAPRTIREALEALRRRDLPNDAMRYLDTLTEPFLSAEDRARIGDANADRVDSLGAPS